MSARSAARTGRGAGDATNVVTDYCYVEGESRSTTWPSSIAITDAFEAAFHKAAKTLVSSEGMTARVAFSARASTTPLRSIRSAGWSSAASGQVEALGLTPIRASSTAGSPPTTSVCTASRRWTFGAARTEAHTVDEWVDIPAFHNACRLALALVYGPADRIAVGRLRKAGPAAAPSPISRSAVPTPWRGTRSS